ncbi:transposable element gene [Prunus dulcis]|uniref:Transposable element protein n=1 Tax=Prunus dulcis TaxID=3755 RepID=A0A4Y1RR86_PRUDU|nr:transposable element gene [Prunus dulcis]
MYNSSGGSVTLGNDTVAQVRGIGEVELKMTSGKTLTLKDVRHVPEVRRNLISGSSLVKQGYKIVMESNRIVITRNDVFIGKGYTKDEVFNKLKIYKNEVENQLEKKIKRLRSDRGGEYTSNELGVFCEEHGIIHEVTPPYSPQSNGVAERKNRTLMDMTRISKEVQISEKPSSSTTIENLESQELRRSKRARVEKNFGDDFYTFLVEGDPTTYKEAVMSVDAPFWKEAINDEFQSIIQNNTWMLTNLPAGNKAIGCKWVFRKKLKPDGSIDKYKARLVAKGFTQKKGIDYFDTYSPVSRITTIRTLIALASVHNLVIHQMDVKTAFLNGDLDEEIYMEQPEGFIVKGQEHKVCKLVKSLYGLKQAPKQWHEKFDKVILDYDFKFNGHDKCVYYKENNGEHVILCLYVDDILIFGTNLEIVNDVKSYLSRNFDMKDMGEAHVILGMKIEKTTQGISLSQSSTIEKMLKKFNYFECKPTPTPYDPNVHLKKNQGEPFSQLKYSQMIGSLLYIANKTRPDIAYAVGRLSRYTHNPSKEHWNALERVFKYLRGTIDYSLCYKGFPNVVEGYSDANWITDNEEVKSTSGYIFLLGGAAISWGSKKQTIISRSTMESELIALDTTCTEAE